MQSSSVAAVEDLVLHTFPGSQKPSLGVGNQREIGKIYRPHGQVGTSRPAEQLGFFHPDQRLCVEAPAGLLVKCGDEGKVELRPDPEVRLWV